VIQIRIWKKEAAALFKKLSCSPFEELRKGIETQ
jgi:hypothetical protein